MTEAVAKVEKQEILDPRTGEVVDLTKVEPDWLAEFLAWIKKLEADCKAAKSALNEEVHRRMDLDASWRIEADSGVVLEGVPPSQKDYDAELLRANLAGLVKNGVISKAALDACFRTPKPKPPEVAKKGVNSLLKTEKPEVETAVEKSKVPPPTRRVTVKVPSPS